MKKKLSAFFLSTVIMFTMYLNAFAAVSTVGEINEKISNLQVISNYDFSTLVSKNELIGNRLQNFNMLTSQYKNDASLAQENLQNLINEIEILGNSYDIPESEKTMQIKKLYQEADTIIYNMDSKTMQYMYAVGGFMPSITYQRFSKKFSDFYNNLGISNTKILSK